MARHISNSTPTTNKMVYLSSCCGCIGLQRGTTITAILQIILGAISMIYKSYLAAAIKKELVFDSDPHWGLYKIAVAAAVVSALHVVFGFVLYAGIHNKNTKYLASWLCFMAAILVVSLIFVVVILVQSVQADGQTKDIVPKFIIGLVMIVVEAYIVVVVYSFYKMLKSDDSMKEYQ